MPLKQTSVRMSRTTYELIAREAAREGVSVSMYMREAAFARAWTTIHLRGGHAEAQRTLEEAQRVAQSEP